MLRHVSLRLLRFAFALRPQYCHCQPRHLRRTASLCYHTSFYHASLLGRFTMIAAATLCYSIIGMEPPLRLRYAMAPAVVTDAIIGHAAFTLTHTPRLTPLSLSLADAD